MSKFKKDSFNYLWANVVSGGIGFFTLPIYTRYLSPSDYGVVVLFIMFGTVASGLLSFGLKSATYRYYFEYKDDQEAFRVLNSTNFLFNIATFSLSGVVVFYLADGITTIFFDGKIAAKLIRWSFISGCLQYLIMYIMFLLTAQTRSGTFSIVTILRILLNTGFSFYFIFAYSLTYMARIYATLLTQTVVLVCLLVITRHLFSMKLSFPHIKKSLQFSYPFIPMSFIGLAYSSFDKTMLSTYKGLTSVGYYNFGEKFALLLKTIMDSVSKVWMPFFMEESHKNTAEAKEAITSRFFKLAFLFMFGGLVIIYFSEEMIKLLTTELYYPSMYLTPVFVYHYMFGIMGILSVSQVMYAEKVVLMLPSSIASIVINIGLNVILIPKYGAIGAAFATAIASLGSHIVLLYFGLRAYPLPGIAWKLTCMFILVLVFTWPVYILMPMDMNFILKIISKIVILSLFVIVGVKLDYISWGFIKGLSKGIISQRSRA